MKNEPQSEPLNNGDGVILPYECSGEYFIESLGVIPRKPVYSFIKRLFDIVASACALVVLAIPMLVIGVAVRCTSPGRALYRQERLGKDGKPFLMVKFRSMREDAETDGAQWSQGDDDPRITGVGAFLRKSRLDELPQFWCVLTGKMTLVGPRPERQVFYDKFEEYIHGFRERLKVKPGITGLAQVNGGYNLKPEEKICFDVEYIRSRSVWLDFKIMLKTIKVVLRGDGAK